MRVTFAWRRKFTARFIDHHGKLLVIYLHILHLIRRKDFHSLSRCDRDVVAANYILYVTHPHRNSRTISLCRSTLVVYPVRRGGCRRARYRRIGASIPGPVKTILSRKAAAIYRECPALISKRKKIARVKHSLKARRLHC